MKLLTLLIFLACTCSTYAQADFYKISLKSLTNDSIKMRDLKGKVLLIVNTATDSSNSQLLEIDSFYQHYKDSGLVVIAVPSDDFGNERQTGSGLQAKYAGYHFAVAEKQHVKGTGQSALYQWLGQGSLNGIVDNPVNGDFDKFLVNRKGRLVGAFHRYSGVWSNFFQSSFHANK